MRFFLHFIYNKSIMYINLHRIVVLSLENEREKNATTEIMCGDAKDERIHMTKIGSYRIFADEYFIIFVKRPPTFPCDLCVRLRADRTVITILFLVSLPVLQ